MSQVTYDLKTVFTTAVQLGIATARFRQVAAQPAPEADLVRVRTDDDDGGLQLSPEVCVTVPPAPTGRPNLSPRG